MLLRLFPAQAEQRTDFRMDGGNRGWVDDLHNDLTPAGTLGLEIRSFSSHDTVSTRCSRQPTSHAIRIHSNRHSISTKY